MWYVHLLLFCSGQWSPKKIVQCSVEPFCVCIALRSVGCCPWFVDTIHVAHFKNDSRLKVTSLVRVETLRNPVFLKPFLLQLAVRVYAVSFLVGTASVNFVNIFMRTRTFSLPSWAGSIIVKSIATISRGCVARTGCNGAQSAGICALAVLQRRQCLLYARMSV